jgi:hypothetical protein
VTHDDDVMRDVIVFWKGGSGRQEVNGGVAQCGTEWFNRMGRNYLNRMLDQMAHRV